MRLSIAAECSVHACAVWVAHLYMEGRGPMGCEMIF
jgi:hypothetical protein